MALAFVDNGTLDLVVQHLDSEDPYAWSISNVFGLTSLLLSGPPLCLAPGLASTDRTAKDHCDLLAHRLLTEGLVTTLDPAVLADHPKCVDDCLRWARQPEHIETLRGRVDSLHEDERSYSNWVEWAMTRSLKGYSTRHRGLVEELFIPTVAHVYDLSPADADGVLRLGRQPNELKGTSPGSPRISKWSAEATPLA